MIYQSISSTPGDSSMMLSKFFPSSMVFAHFAKARLPFILCIPESFFDAAAEFTLCYGLHFRPPCWLGRYFILPLSTPHYCNVPGLSNGLLGNYPCRTFTGKCDPALLGAHKKTALSGISTIQKHIFGRCKIPKNPIFQAVFQALIYFLHLTSRPHTPRVLGLVNCCSILRFLKITLECVVF